MLKILNNYKQYDSPYRLTFLGGAEAENLNNILIESYEGVKKNNLVLNGDNIGFLAASIDGRPWTDTMWTRDAGTMIREFIARGDIGTACLCSNNLIKLCLKNPEGFYTFPEWFALSKPAYGSETDGTASILIAFAKLYEILKLGTQETVEFSKYLFDFSTGNNSPLRYFLIKIKKDLFLAGSGEFGGGLEVNGYYYNIVQNMLVSYSLKCWADAVKSDRLNLDLYNELLSAYDNLNTNIKKYFIEDGKFVWCLNTKTLKPDEDVILLNSNAGFAGINGVFSMASDALGFDLNSWEWYEIASNTFFDLLKFPKRKAQFEKYGIYIQFNQFCHGLLSSAYGIGYAMQCAVLMRNHMLDKMLNFFIKNTVNPHPDYKLTRDNKYWTYERMLSPDYFSLPADMQDIEEGCGALNLVNVSEYLKVARLMTGVSQKGNDAEPFLPIYFKGFEIENIAVIEDNKVKKYNYKYDGKNLVKTLA